MKKVMLALVLLVCALAAHAEPASNEDAQDAVLAFLSLVDQRQYDKSYLAASAVLRKEVSQQDWVAHISNLRAPLGPLVERTFSASEPQESLPEAPPGEYIIFTFDSSFENNKYITEVVAGAKGSDGVWRIIGYYFE